MSLEYVTNPEETHVLRGYVIVADIVDGKIKMRAEHRKYAIGAGKFWKAFKGAPATETLHIPSPQDTVTEAGFVRHGEGIVMDASGVRLEKRAYSENDPKTAKEHMDRGHPVMGRVVSESPPCPPMDPALGTKTPAVVAWFKEFRPNEWAEMHKLWGGR